MTDKILTSDDIDYKSPFPATNEFVVRSIQRGWNNTAGCEQWHLRPQSGAMQIKDKRVVVVDNDSRLLQAIIAADPRVANLKRTYSRDLLPSYKVVVKQRGIYCYIEKWAVLDIQKSEQMRIDDRARFDALDDLRIELGLGKPEADNLIRQCLGKNDWWVLAEQAIRAKKTSPVDTTSPYGDGTLCDTVAATATSLAFEAAERERQRAAQAPLIVATEVTDQNQSAIADIVMAVTVYGKICQYCQKPIMPEDDDNVTAGTRLDGNGSTVPVHGECFYTHEATEEWRLKHPECKPFVDIKATHISSELNKWFGPKKGAKVDDPATDALSARLNELAAQQSGDELTAPAPAEDWGDFWVSVKNLAKGLIDKPEALRDYVHNFFDVVSVKDTGKNRGQMLMELKAHFTAVWDERAELKKTAVKKADTSQPQATTADDSVPSKIEPKNPSNLGIQESERQVFQPLLKVYPADFGSIVYKGIKFSVTMGDGATFDMALRLMEEFAAHADMIIPTCKVSAQPSNVSQMPVAPQLPTTNSAPQAAPQVGGKPDNKGRVPGQTGVDVITALEKQVNNGNEIICLWKQNGQFAEHRLNRDSDKAMVAALGISIAGMVIGTKYPCNLTAPWVVTSNLNSKGTYYRDVTALTDNGNALPLAS